MIIGIPNKRDIMEPCAGDAQPVMQTVRLASVPLAKSTVVAVTSSASSTRESSDTKDRASITAIKSPRSHLHESLSLGSESPTSPCGESLTKVARHNQGPYPLNAFLRDNSDQHLEQYLRKKGALANTDCSGNNPTPFRGPAPRSNQTPYLVFFIRNNFISIN